MVRLLCLEHTRFEAGGFGHHLVVPGWFKSQFNIDLVNGRYDFDLAAHIVNQDITPCHSPVRSASC